MNGNGNLEGSQGRSNATGFTLIELLIVIAIIAILAAILFPVFARARENARRASCQSNLKQLALSVMQYTQDYDEYHKGMDGWQFTNIAPDGWTVAMAPYIKSSAVIVCPSWSPRPAAGVPTYTMNGMLAGAAKASGVRIGAFQSGSGCDGNPCTGQGVPLSAIAFPSQTILMVEDITGSKGGWLTYVGTGGLYGFDASGSNIQQGRQIHLDGMNMSFVDGHVKWYSTAKLLTLGTTVPFAGFLNGARTGANNFYKHNGDIDMQVTENDSKSAS